jgi:outer membrane receptor protein involved in Fe transport
LTVAGRHRGLQTPRIVLHHHRLADQGLQQKFTLTAGVKNLFDIDPPFTIRNAGGGNQSGYDGRYADPLGRQIYLVGNYKF